jgi:hypothetical protein
VWIEVLPEPWLPADIPVSLLQLRDLVDVELHLESLIQLGIDILIIVSLQFILESKRRAAIPGL